MNRKNTPEFIYDPEIERSFRWRNRSNRQRRIRQQLLRQQRDSAMAEEQNRELAQQPDYATQNPILMANSSTRPMREYVSPILYDFSPGIIYPTPDGTRFEMKSVILQMLQTAGQFGGGRGEDPHAHMKRFLETCNSFVIPGITPEAIRLSPFPYSLRDDAKQWVSSLGPGEITTWDKLVEKFMQKYFPPTTNGKRRREIMTFKQEDIETLSAAWERFKALVKNCPNHGLPLTIQMETFYGGLNRASQMAADAAAAGGLMDKSYAEAKEILDCIAKHNMEWIHLMQQISFIDAL